MLKSLLYSFLLIPLVFISHISFARNVDLQVVTELSPPYQVMNGSEVSGTVTTKVREILAKANLTATFNMYPWARAFQQVTKEPNTLIYSMGKTPQRLDEFIWLAPVAHFKLGLVALKSRDDLTIQIVEELSQYVVAVQRQDIAHNWMVKQGLIEGKHFIISADIESSWNLLINKKVDFIVDTPELMESMLQELGLPKNSVRFVLPIPELSFYGYLAANKNIDGTVLTKLKQAIKD